MKKYWFKPKKFWRWFAAYYPITREGWITTIGALVAIFLIFMNADGQSHSVSDAFFTSAPKIIIVLLAFDIISFRTGEYPSWWNKNHESR